MLGLPLAVKTFITVGRLIYNKRHCSERSCLFVVHQVVTAKGSRL